MDGQFQKYKEKFHTRDIGLGYSNGDVEVSEYLCQIIKKGGDELMITKLITHYEANLPSPNYKTQRFGRTIEESFPEDVSKEDFMKAAEKSQTICEALVSEDIARHKG